MCKNNPAGQRGYLIVIPASATGCENEGAYPAVDPVTGGVYIGYESNWYTSGVQGAPCYTVPISNVVAMVPARCLRLASHATCGASASRSAPVVSLESAPIPGYSRFPGNDFPRLAVSDPAGTVSMVWNDTRYHPLGDILLQSFNLRSLARVQAAPVVLDQPVTGSPPYVGSTLYIAWSDGRTGVPQPFEAHLRG